MLCYAWNVLAIKNEIKVSLDNYDDAYNLLGRIFSYGIGKLIKSGFRRSYIQNEEELSTLRGKINIQKSINQLSPQRKKLVCNYDEYSTNDIFNQILNYTITLLIKNESIDKSLKKTLKKQKIFFDGIEEKEPSKTNRQKLIFNKNNVTYKLLICIAIMLYDNTSINEESGQEIFSDFFREEQMHRVFELFILNFYTIHLSNSSYKVHAPKINWNLEDSIDDDLDELFNVSSNIGDRRTDIVVENKIRKIQFIIDAKYYKEMLVPSYRNEDILTYRMSHLNQVRGYVLDSVFEGKKYGALIYPSIKPDKRFEVGELVRIKDSPILFKTINLNSDWKNIEADLLDFVYKVVKRD
jgi:5-methylcytosine-specific restriction enzyme subunit McrC